MHPLRLANNADSAHRAVSHGVGARLSSFETASVTVAILHELAVAVVRVAHFLLQDSRTNIRGNVLRK